MEQENPYRFKSKELKCEDLCLAGLNESYYVIDTGGISQGFRRKIVAVSALIC